jgi:hypothetical protein
MQQELSKHNNQSIRLAEAGREVFLSQRKIEENEIPGKTSTAEPPFLIKTEVLNLYF